MAIKLPDPGNGIPEQKTGNDEWTNMKIVRDNFADQSNAASRLVGTERGQIPLSEQVFKSAYSFEPVSTIQPPYSGTKDVNEFPIGTRYYANRANNQNLPPIGDHFIIETRTLPWNITKMQIAYSYADEPVIFYRTSYSYGGGVIEWFPWRQCTQSLYNYTQTTATAPNLVVSSDGSFKRASSSAKYKDVIGNLELDSDLYQKAMQVNPIIYRSKSEGDPKDWHYMSFLAEELGELDPSLTQWLVKTHDDKGKDLDEPIKEAEGINLNAICAVLHATNVYQDKKLKELEQRLTALESNNEPTI